MLLGNLRSGEPPITTPARVWQPRPVGSNANSSSLAGQQTPMNPLTSFRASAGKLEGGRNIFFIHALLNLLVDVDRSHEIAPVAMPLNSTHILSLCKR